jgi:hypothetical protein
MVRLQTMLVNAADCAPITAAALPPPGVAALLANSSRNTATDLSFISLMDFLHYLGLKI